MRMSVAALFVIAQNQKLPGCPSAVQWINELWHIHAIKAPMRMNNLNTCTSMKTLTSILLSEKAKQK